MNDEAMTTYSNLWRRRNKRGEELAGAPSMCRHWRRIPFLISETSTPNSSLFGVERRRRREKTSRIPSKLTGGTLFSLPFLLSGGASISQRVGSPSTIAAPIDKWNKEADLPKLQKFSFPFLFRTSIAFATFNIWPLANPSLDLLCHLFLHLFSLQMDK